MTFKTFTMWGDEANVQYVQLCVYLARDEGILVQSVTLPVTYVISVHQVFPWKLIVGAAHVMITSENFHENDVQSLRDTAIPSFPMRKPVGT